MNYDLFGTLYEKLDQPLRNGRGVVDFSVRIDRANYSKARDLANTVSNLLGTDISAGTAWQLSEAAHMIFSARAAYAARELRRMPRGDSNRVDRQVKEKPIWGKPANGAGDVFDRYVLDSGIYRVTEATQLPPLCFRMEIVVPMKSPIVIKGERPFVAHENPFCTDKVTGWPLLRPSSLKGQLRTATYGSLVDALPVKKDRMKHIEDLFGPEEVEEGNGRRGRIEFLPCYLPDPITWRVMAPHSEKTRRIDPGPVTLEVVAAKKVSLWLQYWPIDLLAAWLKGNGSVRYLYQDFKELIGGLNFWFQESGIGSKTSSGFGKAKCVEALGRVVTAPGSSWDSIWKTLPKNQDGYAPLPDLSKTLREGNTLSEWEKTWNAHFPTPEEKEVVHAE